MFHRRGQTEYTGAGQGISRITRYVNTIHSNKLC